MIKVKTGKAKSVKIGGIALLIFAILFFLLRGPYLSNSIKRSIIPVLENVTRERVLIDKAVINLFPFYVQAKGLKLFDRDGNRILWVTKTRAYIDLLGLLSKEVRIRRLTLKEPELTADKKDLQRILDNIKKSSSIGEKGSYKVSLKNIKLTEGIVKYSDREGGGSISGTGLFLSMNTINNSVAINMMMDEGTLKLPNKSELPVEFKGKFSIKDGKIDIDDINLLSSKSSIDLQGSILLASDGKIEGGSIEGDVKVYSETLMRGFGLKEIKDSMLFLNGSIELVENNDSKWPGFKFNLQAESRFYLETLMEIINVNETIQGKLAYKGRIRGIFPEIIGEGAVTLEDAVFATLPIDDLSGDIRYEDMRFSLSRLIAHTYNGEFKGRAHILIPSGEYYVNADVSDMSSPRFFEYIKWDPPFQDGELSGNFELKHKPGQNIAVTADLDYLNTMEDESDVLARVKTVHTLVELRDNILSFSDTTFSTKQSHFYMDGQIDLKNKEMDMALRLETRDVRDLTSPYYSGISARASFNGTAKGPAGGPIISGSIEMDSGNVQGIQVKSVLADFTYSSEILAVDRMRIEQERASCALSGSIRFRGSEKLFSFKDPYYSARAEVGNIELRQFAEIMYDNVPVSGSVTGILSFEGDRSDYKSNMDLVVINGDLYGQHIDRVNVKGVLNPDNMDFHSVSVFQGDSNLAASGKIFFDRKIIFSALSNNLQLNDIMVLRDWPVDAAMNLELSGSGTIDNPIVEFSINLNESSFKKMKIGKGKISGKFEDRKLSAAGSFIDGTVTVKAGASFAEEMSWFADLNIKRDRYDFLVTSFMDEVPDDFMVVLEGNINMKGKDREFEMNSIFDFAKLSLYGYSFENKKDIVIETAGDEVRIESFSLSGQNAELSAEGSIAINRQFDLKLTGNLDITPLRILNEKISSLRGKGLFAVDITGPWENPEFVGKINVRDATVSIADFPYKIGPVYGTLYLKKDRIIFDSFDAEFAGGNIAMSGAGYMNKLALDKLFISSIIKGIRVRPMEEVNAVFDGGLFYEYSTESSSLTGDIEIQKAKYRKDVEFTSVILGLKEVKEAPAEYPDFLKETELNVHIAGSGNIFIDNNIAQAPVMIDLNIMGTAAKFGLIGRIEADEGNIYFRGNEFKVLKGSSVEFIEPNRIAPVFHILAEAYISNYYIKMVLDGTMDRFDVSLFSDPPLPEVDILSLLTFGELKGGDEGLAGGLAASEAASLLTGNLQGEVQDTFKNITGFERFEVEPHTTTTGAFSPKVTVGKRLLENKLSVTYSTSIGTTEEPIIKLKYNLNKKVSLEGSRNEIGSAGADIKYRFEFK